MGAVSVPATGTVGQAVPMSASATDRWSGANLSWAFGDGATGAGGAPSHAYGAPGVYTVTVTATDGAGNATSAQRTIQVSNPPAPSPPPPPPVVLPSAPVPTPTPRLTFTLAFKYRASKSSTTLTSLVAQSVPAGSTVTVTCTGPKHKGKPTRCPVKTFRKTNAHGTVKLNSFLHKALKSETLIEVRVTRNGAIGAVQRLAIRSVNGPSTTTKCLRPGSTIPTTTC
jgi:PKD repeat protein